MLHVYDIIVRGLEGGQQNLNSPFLIFFDPLAATVYSEFVETGLFILQI